MTGWQHEKLDAYRRALEVVALLESVAAGIPDRWAELRDQLRRASASIPLNLAEGASEYSPSEKARFYRFARRSAAECSAILDVLARIMPPHGDSAQARAGLDEVAAMLTSLVLAVETRRRRT